MLSTKEIAEIRQRLDAKLSKNTRKKLKKMLTEHKYASKYPPFTPLSHRRCFVNRTTSENTLLDLIRSAEIAPIFLLDTESTPIPYRPNEPALIQLQIVPPEKTPTIVLVEVNHLPPVDSASFGLIQEFFTIALNPEKEIYSWGSIDELNDFVKFGLFTQLQLDGAGGNNFQEKFKTYWQSTHPHTGRPACQCEACIGQESDKSWSLQAAVGEQLQEWLDKRATCAEFGVGLDPELYTTSQERRNRYETLVKYAMNDVLSIERLMISIQEHLPSEREIKQQGNTIPSEIHVDETVEQTAAPAKKPPPPSPRPSARDASEKSHRENDQGSARPDQRHDYQQHDDRRHREDRHEQRPDLHRIVNRPRNDLRRKEELNDDHSTMNRREIDDLRRKEELNDHRSTMNRRETDDHRRKEESNDHRSTMDRREIDDLRRKEESYNHRSAVEYHSTNDRRLTDGHRRAPDHSKKEATNDRRPTNDPHRTDDHLRNSNSRERSPRRHQHENSYRNNDLQDRSTLCHRSEEHRDHPKDCHGRDAFPGRSSDLHFREDRRNNTKDLHQQEDRRNQTKDLHQQEDRRNQTKDLHQHEGRSAHPNDPHRTKARHDPQHNRQRSGEDRSSERQTREPTPPQIPSPSETPSRRGGNEEQKRWRNRKATLKQRRRSYRHEIIRRGIDPRFTIKMVKEILRRFGVTYSALNIAKSATSGRTSLYIGIRQKSNLQKSEVQTRALFTTDAYNEFRARHRL